MKTICSGRNDMSTCFYVYPGNEYMPTFKELLIIANEKTNDFLRDLNCKQSVSINVEVHKKIDHALQEFNCIDRLAWSNDLYAWFFVNGVAGGTDSYYCQIDDDDKDIWKDEIATNKKAQTFSKEINRSLDIGHYWYFRRSAGQPAIINLAYGLLSAALVLLTEGYIYSDDGAWDYNYFPITAGDFFKWYFKPEFSDYNKTWFQECIESIKSEFK